jgi:hypothetical protein
MLMEKRFTKSSSLIQWYSPTADWCMEGRTTFPPPKAERERVEKRRAT